MKDNQLQESPIFATLEVADTEIPERRIFAAMAMQALATKDEWLDLQGFSQTIAHDAVRIADALIAELNKQQP